MILKSAMKIQQIYESLGDTPVGVMDVARKFNLAYASALKYLLILHFFELIT